MRPEAGAADALNEPASLEGFCVDQRAAGDVEPETTEVRDQAVHVDTGARRDDSEYAVMRHDPDDAATGARERARERGVEPFQNVDVRLASRRRGQLAAPPRVAHPRPAFVDLRQGVTLPLTAVPLAKARVGDH